MIAVFLIWDLAVRFLDGLPRSTFDRHDATTEGMARERRLFFEDSNHEAVKLVH